MGRDGIGIFEKFSGRDGTGLDFFGGPRDGTGRDWNFSEGLGTGRDWKKLKNADPCNGLSTVTFVFCLPEYIEPGFEICGNFPGPDRLELEQNQNFPDRDRLELEQISNFLAQGRLEFEEIKNFSSTIEQNAI